ncbi:ribokinase [Janthinobacterium lividum]|jgi:ribokinase|uniref:Ribokinase n=1 Tax=Janthinobacterium lividum TaxID=29581 RepID=A0ABU0Y3G9_9BURK|nr:MULTISPECIES: ribokinase [Janthinobacterium]MCC7716135.1 ribokinase [Janthinobacterium lividum]MDQ4629710.1 ribokinase [Janthinobacterium lividum]MDQ4677843.1 ribokinase [Janthinobacterium lividum]MDQ4688526.1 ribokinase [Janthinobacterium lividum]OEZ49344.1 ribokinase [Janthinobacterium sp. MP5059B]
MIVVIGSINMDLVLRVPRMPLPGETLTGGAFRTIPGGKGANQAVACARLSGKVAGAQQVAMVACVGDDAFGTTLRAALVGDGIIDSHITTLPGVASGIASILVDDNGQNSIVIAGGANDLLSPAHIDAAQGLIEQADIVVLQLETPMATVVHAIKLARSLGKTVVLNPAPAASLPEGVLELVDYLIPNEIEAAMLAGVSPEGADAKALAAALQKLGSDNVIITLGSKGVHAALYGGDFTFPAEVVKAVDTTAAGDTFIGGFVAGLASGMDEAEAIQQGQRAAAWSVTKPGAQTSIPHLHELF